LRKHGAGTPDRTAGKGLKEGVGRKEIVKIFQKDIKVWESLTANLGERF
jgi:hypothetical protein